MVLKSCHAFVDTLCLFTPQGYVCTTYMYTYLCSILFLHIAYLPFNVENLTAIKVSDRIKIHFSRQQAAYARVRVSRTDCA